MKKNKSIKSRRPRAGQISREQALEFLENFQKMISDRDTPTKPISIRVPGNVLEAYRTIAKSEGRSYQTLMIQALREHLIRLRGK